jgi:hypothetical protein
MGVYDNSDRHCSWKREGEGGGERERKRAAVVTATHHRSVMSTMALAPGASVGVRAKPSMRFQYGTNGNVRGS